ncbi:MAG: protein kinase domain-containing protein [Nannocystaceae bacterium]|nr:protein kinase [bacterium]
MKPSKKPGDDEADGARPVARTRTETNAIDEIYTRRNDDDKDAIPHRLGRYTILSRVGRGAVGEVFEAEPPEPGASAVAIKAIRGMSPDALYRFKREFRALADVRHRNVIRLHELMLQGDRLFFSMELIRGLGFAEALCGSPRDGTRSLHEPARDYDKVRDAMRQLAEGVQAIHDAGFLHRDLKPSNVLVEESGRVVILDFGLVRDINPDDGVGVTADGAVLGTPLFMSPEQACGGDIGPASDWYTVGEMLYQLLTGAPPYAGLGLIALLAAKKEELPKLPSERIAGIPPDLQSLCMDLLARDPHKRPSGHEILSRLGSTEPVDFPEDKTALFLGRDNELRGLQRAFAALTKGSPVVVMLEGVSGIGKSALVEQFLRRVSRNDGALVLSGKCSERESIPYKALDSVMDMVSAYLRAMPTAPEVQAVLPRNITALARLFPVLLSVPAIAVAPLHVHPDVMPHEARRRGIESLRELFGRIADRRPLVVYIDDLQWSDLDSLVVLESMLHDMDAPPLMMICSFREGAPERTQILGRFIADLHAIEPPLDLRPMRLGPMGLEEARGLALRMLGDDSPIHQTLAAEVAREAEGSPFFVAQLVRHAQRTQRGDLSETDSAVSLDDVIRHRLDLMSPAARRMLAVVSVAGGRMEIGMATRLAQVEGASQNVLADLRAESLVRTDGTEDTDSVEIYHDRIRETVLRDLPARSTRDLHRLLAEALLETTDPDPSDLSHHFRRAGEPQLASTYTIAAADQAAEALAFDRAAELYRTALDLETIEDEQRADIEERCARSLASAGRLYEAAKVFLSASDLLPDAQRPPLLQAAAELLLTSGHSREGRVVLKQVLGAQGVNLPESRGRAIASLLWNRAALAVKKFHVDPAKATPADPTTAAKLDALWTAARGLIYTEGMLGAGFQAQHLRLSLASRDPIHLARALGFEAHLTASMKPVSKRDHCFGLLAHADALADDANSPYARGMVHQARGHVQLFLGEWRNALNSLDEGNRIFMEETTGAAQEIGFCEAHAVLCLQFMGRAQELAPRAHDLLRASTQHAHPYSQGFARGLLGHLVYLAADRPEDAEEQLTLYRDGAPWGFQAHIQNYVSQTTALLRYKGDIEAAWRLVEARAPEIEGFDLMRSPFSQAEHRFWISQNAIAMAQRRPGERDEFLDIADGHGHKLVATQPIHYQRGYGHLTLGNVHERRGDLEVAAGHYRRAIDAFDAHDMDSFAAVSSTRLAHLIGGSEADDLRARVREYVEREQIVAPARLFEMMSPGSAEAVP